MGEKEIKPADPKPQDPGATPYGGTQEKPGTGTGTPDSGNKGGGGGGNTNKGGGGSGSSGGSTATGSVDYGDGYTMGRNEAGDTYLNHPDGSTATWDPSSQTWKGDGGSTKGGDWSGGHRPTDFGPQH